MTVQTGKRMIGNHSEEHLLKTAKTVLEKKTKDSVVLDPDAELKIPKFELDGTCCPNVFLVFP
jgi:hypothetical protein